MPKKPLLQSENETRDAAWAKVADWRKRLEDSENYPILDALESTWEMLDSSYGGLIKRDGLERTSDSPLAALFFLLDSGFYPPPELLFALPEAFEEYKAANGTLSLEQVFFGPAKRKAGNYAQRSNKQFRDVWLEFEMHKLLNQGHTKIKAAEILSRRLGGKPEPESLVRQIKTDDTSLFRKK
jgi:hypothetical protein